jgi:hypothetical protein
MPPRKRRQRAGAMNYRKRKDVTVARGDGGSGAVEGRVEGSEAHGKLETEERGFEERSEEVRDDGGSGTVEERVEESEEAECGPSSSSLHSSEEAPTATKRRRLSEITAMGDEPLQAWLDSLPREDFQHMALLLYTRLPALFGLKKTDTAAAVGEILQKNERTIRRWVDDFASNSGEFSDSQQGHYTRNNTLMSNEEISERARVYVRENAAPKGIPTSQPQPSVSG